MKLFFLIVAFALLCIPVAAQTYGNIDDQTAHWGTCNLCSGGTGISTGVSQTFNNASPSLDGGSMLLSMTGQAGLPSGQTTNQIWYYKPEATGSVDTFVGTYNVFLTNESLIQDLEYDQFQFNVGHRFMMGSQCQIGGVWQIWNQLTGTWVNTSPSVSCNLPINQWNSIVWYTHRDPLTSIACSGQPCMYYDKLTVNGVSAGPFQTLPSGLSADTDNVGLNIQIDVKAAGGVVTESVDETSLQVSVSQVAAPNNPQTKVYVVFPPETGNANAHFTQYVMPQPAIAGVSDQFVWSKAELTDPTSNGSCFPLGTDTCQKDSFGFYHTYSWTNADGIFAQWFNPNSGWGQKQVNIFAVEQTNGPNSATPYYLTESAWTSVTGTQHYINAAKDTCSQDVGAGVTSIIRLTGGSNVATVTQTAHGYNTGDTAWIYGSTDNTFNIQTQAGVTVTKTGPNTWTYPSGGTTAVTANGGTAIKTESQQQSWFVPTDPGYTAAAQAFIAATIAHFNASGNLANIGYARLGPTVRGAEIVMLCPDQMVADGVPGYGSQAAAKNTWLAWYQTMVSFVASQNPLFQIMDPLNPGWTSTNNDYTYDAPMAASAIGASNANGQRNGFGSQGLQQSDLVSTIPPPPYAAADWVNQANNYWTAGVLSPGSQPIEGQQIDCSDPTAIWKGTSWVSGLQGVSCFQLGSGASLKSKTGDLRVLAPYMKKNHLNIWELYNIDALLAYDPTYCVLSGASCGTGSVPAAVYGMRCVGSTSFLDPNCPNGVGGDGTYALAINTQAGFGTGVGCTIPTCATGSFTIGGTASPGYSARTDTLVSQPVLPTPNMGGLTGAGNSYTPPGYPTEFGITVYRLTDAIFDPSKLSQNSWVTTASGEAQRNQFSCGDNLIMLAGATGGGARVKALNQSTFTLSGVYPTGPFVTHSTWYNATGDSGGWSFNCASTPNRLYLNTTDKPSQVQSFDFTGYASNPSGSPVQSVIYNYVAGSTGSWGTTTANCLPADFNTGGWNTFGRTSINPPDSVFAMGFALKAIASGVDTISVTNGSNAFTLSGPTPLTRDAMVGALITIAGVQYAFATINVGGLTGTLTTNYAGTTNATAAFALLGGQDLGSDIVVYVPGSGCRHLNTSTMTVTGDFGPTGAVTGITDHGYIHGITPSPDGTYVSFKMNNCTPGFTCNAGNAEYYWAVSGVNIFLECIAGNQCSGHQTEGFHNIINTGGGLGNAFMQMQIRPIGSNPAYTNLIPGLPWPTCNSFPKSYDTHYAWNNVDAADSVPIIGTSALTASNAEAPGFYDCPTNNEVLGVSPVNGTVYRFAHTQASGLSWDFNALNAIGNLSQSGKYFMWASDWQGTLGKDDNTPGICTVAGAGTNSGSSGGAGCRTDVFLIALPTAGGGSSIQ